MEAVVRFSEIPGSPLPLTYEHVVWFEFLGGTLAWVDNLQNARNFCMGQGWKCSHREKGEVDASKECRGVSGGVNGALSTKI